ncbi:DegT/DnrJ/EryC1/StrS family aminotransferase [Aliarcobacter butzleri]|jgi:dTDP-4-amino-4,6-dideoxygalactose transaminase|uniref:DegT/DnrJ/EryC1/StrS family aminotransferase n=5 Tax=root TaxID=1 RepID=A0AAP4PTR5_9BACT|nr:DegT/DnrJ/EryC1/StrS family aminotransferase [Aliarcobacter butzleri]MCP3649253.1 DegT/DnrJ/EryC1/StrS family aminotransferase [Arcobacter sp. DNRA7]AGR77542.1 DegT/DnrJ/EryC1/StrS aminotransferase [Aliarcobacter butzleri 7h1h]EFU69203.1 wbgx protein [Aliarcobacter butzleri JV22]KLD97176.1 aminotransferase DegT [Aliarcobacter butzleri L349]KLE02274.1 aminotransferase DegT [Aliarcobacter butzleri L351]
MKNIAIYKATLDNEELNQIRSVLESKNDLSKVLEFEEKMTKYIGAKYAIATSTSTAAIHLALSSIKLKRGDKILMSVNSFINLPEVVRHFDAEPIFIDINMEDMNIDIDKFEEALANNDSKKLRGAIITFIGGQAPDLDRIYDIAKKYGIILIEDCRAALGSTYKGQRVGNLRADMTIFSTNPSPSKYAISRSGVIVTNNEEIAKRAKLLRSHAITTTYDSYGNLDYIYDVVDIGHKFDLSELDAAYAVAQLNKTDGFIKRRKEIAKLYERRLSNVKHITILPHKDEHIFTQFIIKISRNRDAFARALKERGVATGLNYIPLHLLSYYKNKYSMKITAFPNALNNYQQILSLPIYAGLTDDDINYVCDQVIEVAKDWI